MIPPVKPDTISEEAARPEQVDWPEQETVVDLPVQGTEAPNIEDTGFIWEQELPGDSQGMPAQSPPILAANRVTEVSDIILLGSVVLTAGDPPFILVPSHRDRLRVTLQISAVGEGDLPVFIGSTPDIVPGYSSWRFYTTDPVLFRTRDTIYVAVGPAGTSVYLQWAAEMVSE